MQYESRAAKHRGWTPRTGEDKMHQTETDPLSLNNLMDMHMDASPVAHVNGPEIDKMQARLAWEATRTDVVGRPADMMDFGHTTVSVTGECSVRVRTSHGPTWGCGQTGVHGGVASDCSACAQCTAIRHLGETGAPVCEDTFGEPVRYMVPSLASVGYGFTNCGLRSRGWQGTDTFLDRDAVYVNTYILDLGAGSIISPIHPHGCGTKVYVFRGRNAAGRVCYYAAPAVNAVRELRNTETCMWGRYRTCAGDGTIHEGRAPGSRIDT